MADGEQRIKVTLSRREARAIRSFIQEEYSGCEAQTADDHHPGLVAADAALAAALGEPDMVWGLSHG